MIDLEKEREAFEDQWKKNGYFHFNLERKNGEERYSHRHVNFSFKFWCQRAELAQAEITELKQKLEKIESGKFVLVPKEPTKRMITVGHGYWLPKDVYKAMIEASQQPTNLIDNFIADGGFDQAMGCKNGE